MNEPDDPTLAAVDDAARAASRQLHAHITSKVNPEIALAALPPVDRPHDRRRFVAIAAVAVLLVGLTVSLSDQNGGNDRSRLELDEDGNKLPAPEPGTLTFLGPDDGKDSIGLPVTVEPAVGLEDRDTVTASSPGFVPGEEVGIVQCAMEAGGDSPETRGGIDGCHIGSVVYATADAAGVATGRFTVRRVLTTPLTGTVDCAAEAERCLVAMGAIGDYDRSGGLGVAFIGGGEPIHIPSITVTPADGLHDGDTVHVSGAGFAPHEVVMVSICATNPSACWQTAGTNHTFGVETDDDGRIDDEVVVYRFLPGVEPGTYVDCAISPCSLRLMGNEVAPPPAPLGFVSDDEQPIPPAVAVDPSSGVAIGDEVVVRGAGFEPGTYVSISLCASPVGSPGERNVCSGAGDSQIEVDDEGTFAVELTLPELQQAELIDGGSETTVSCANGSECESVAPEQTWDTSCDGVMSECSIVVEAYSDEEPQTVRFSSAAVFLTFRP
jgi:hypothetical protein